MRFHTKATLFLAVGALTPLGALTLYVAASTLGWQVLPHALGTLGQTRSLIFVAGFIGLLASLISIPVGRYLARGLTSILRDWDSQTRDIGLGRETLGLSQASSRKDEIGLLARSLTRTIGSLRAMQEDLGRAERLAAIGQFSAAIAHEVKNPLAVILTHTQLAKRELGRGEGPDLVLLQESLGFIEQETLRTNQILVQLMGLARKDAPPAAVIDLRAEVSKSLKTLGPLMKQSEVELEVSLTSGPILTRANPDEIHEVLLNLVQNALHAMREKDQRCLRVKLSESEGSAYLTVQDSGLGLSPESMERLFEPFYTTKKAGEGTGLGLAMCQKIIFNHRGKILVASERGKSTTFTIILPTTRAKERAAA